MGPPSRQTGIPSVVRAGHLLDDMNPFDLYGRPAHSLDDAKFHDAPSLDDTNFHSPWMKPWNPWKGPP